MENAQFRIFGASSGVQIRDPINAGGEPVVPQLKDWFGAGPTEPLSTVEFWDLCRAYNDYSKQYAKYWQSQGEKTPSGRAMDGLILPVAPSTAVRDCEFHYFGYSAIANALDYPAAVFPVAVGDETLDVRHEYEPALSAVDEKVGECCKDLQASILAVVLLTDENAAVRSEDIHGMLIGMQVVCPKLQEERTLAFLHVITEALHVA